MRFSNERSQVQNKGAHQHGDITWSMQCMSDMQIAEWVTVGKLCWVCVSPLAKALGRQIIDQDSKMNKATEWLGFTWKSFGMKLQSGSVRWSVRR